MHPLMVPFTNTDFYWNVRLSKLLLPDASGRTAIRLLNSKELLKYTTQGGTMKRRQELEAENPDLFCSEEMTKKLLLDLDKRPSRKDLVFFPGIVTLSYAWLDANHPDPNQAQLKELAPILEWIMSERALLVMRAQGEFRGFSQLDAADGPAAPEFGVFIDFMCVHQIRAEECNTPQETDDFNPVRHNFSLLFAHALTMQLRLTETPGGAGERTFSSRGWCLVEDMLATLVKRPEYRLNISEWKNRIQRFGAIASDEFGTAAGWQKTLEELAAQGDCYAVGHAQTLNTMKEEAQGPLMSHQDLEIALSGRVFGVEEDRALCCAMYRGAAGCLLGERTQLELQESQYEESDWQRLGNALGLCSKLSSLTLRKMQLADGGMRVFCDAFTERGAQLPALTALNLTHNTLGGGGVEALAGAITCGAFPVLETLNLCNARVEYTGFRKLAEAMASGKMDSLTQLDLSSNPLGDLGVGALALLPRGALPRLTKLHLYGCNIGDDGCFALIEALAEGAMPQLSQMDQKDQDGHVDIFRRRNSMGERASLNSLSGRRSSSGHGFRMRGSPSRSGSIGMLVGQNVDLTVEAKEALSAVLADRSKGHALVKRRLDRKLQKGNAAGEMDMLKEEGDSTLLRSQVTTPRGSACCVIS